MFGTIFSFELKRWFKNWVFYLYLAVFFAMGFLAMASAVGVFDGVTVTTTSLMHMNSPYMLNSFIEGFNNLLYFLFPSIIGASIYRDYQYNAHHILYSYPFSKPDYLLGKFLSSFLITLLISLSIGAGIFIATFLPWANEQLIGTNHLWSYVQVYLMNVIPNMIFIGVIVFVVTTLSRSVYVGFVSVVILLILQGIINGLTGDMNNEQLAACLNRREWKQLIIIQNTGLLMSITSTIFR
jgi:ABC-2 type transport system permease protein